MKIGRNDACICGSGKKYKKCCMNKNPELRWKENFDNLNLNIDKKEELKTIIFETYDFMIKNKWKGACHALSTIQYILLNELGLNPKLCIGIVGTSRYEFDHSWIELNNEVYDITIVNGLSEIKISEPIIANINIDKMEKNDLEYGRRGNLDYPANEIKDMYITEYIDGFTNQPEIKSLDFLKEGLWKVTIRFAEKLNLKLDEESLREKYSKVKRTVV